MSKKSKVKLKLSRRTIAIAVVIGGLAVAFGVGTLISWLQRPAPPKEQSEIAGLSDPLLTKSQNQVQQLSNHGQYDEAHKAASQALTNTTDKDEKYVLYMQEGAAYENQEKYTEALHAYQQAKALKTNYSNAVSIGRAAEALGNKQLAIDSYKQALQLLQPNPFYDSDKKLVEDRLKVLGQ